MTQTASLAKDAQSIVSLQAALATAQSAQTTSLAKDAQTIRSAETALANAQTSMQTNLIKDAQTKASAVVAIKNVQMSLRSTQLGNAVKLEPASKADVLSASPASTRPRRPSMRRRRTSPPRRSPLPSTAPSPHSATASARPLRRARSPRSPSTGELDVRVGFSEANAAKLKVGQRATITFDALPAVTIGSVITSVDPTATSVQNVATYYATMSIPGAAGKGVKPGMTASAEVVVNERTGVVVLPSSALTTIGGRTVVTIRKGAVDTRTTVETGLVGTEITSGLSDGDVVVVPSTGASSALSGLSAVLSRTGVGGGGGIAVPAAGAR